MIDHSHADGPQIRILIRKGVISLAGNRRLKIFGLLSCASGKRMSRSNRVFFQFDFEATANGYRPCGHCLHEEYREWLRSHGGDTSKESQK
jgi:hypothetical protein